MSDDLSTSIESSDLEDDGVLDGSDTLDGGIGSDPLDTGYAPPDRWSAGEGFGTTLAEERQGESFDQLLAEEEPDIDPYAVDERDPENDPELDEDPEDDAEQDLRAGRLVAEDSDIDGALRGDVDLAARDVGIDGGAAGAEEAAVHVTREGSAVTPDPDPGTFAVHLADLSTGVTLAYVREGIGGVPLVLLHGYPETKRIWWRNIAPLAEAGFEVIVPDFRGYGDSGLAPDGFYDPVAYSRDVYALVHDVLGHESVTAAAGDVGGVVMLDLDGRYPGFVTRQCFFNSVPPAIPEVYAAAGLAPSLLDDTHATGDYRIRQGRDGDLLAAELSTPALRRSWIAGMYGPRLWAASGSFGPEDVDFHTEPFADAGKLRASWGPYELAYGKPMSDLPMLFSVVDTPTLVLYGMEDHVVPSLFADQCEHAFSQLTGPFLISRAGHFLQWERADVFNQALIEYLLPRT